MSLMVNKTCFFFLDVLSEYQLYLFPVVLSVCVYDTKDKLVLLLLLLLLDVFLPIFSVLRYMLAVNLLTPSDQSYFYFIERVC